MAPRSLCHAFFSGSSKAKKKSFSCSSKAKKKSKDRARRSHGRARGAETCQATSSHTYTPDAYDGDDWQDGYRAHTFYSDAHAHADMAACHGLACLLRTLRFSRSRPHWCDGRGWGGKVWGWMRKPGDPDMRNWNHFFDPDLTQREVDAILHRWHRPHRQRRPRHQHRRRHRRCSDDGQDDSRGGAFWCICPICQAAAAEIAGPPPPPPRPPAAPPSPPSTAAATYATSSVLSFEWACGQRRRGPASVRDPGKDGHSNSRGRSNRSRSHRSRSHRSRSHSTRYDLPEYYRAYPPRDDSGRVRAGSWERISPLEAMRRRLQQQAQEQAAAEAEAFAAGLARLSTEAERRPPRPSGHRPSRQRPRQQRK